MSIPPRDVHLIEVMTEVAAALVLPIDLDETLVVITTSVAETISGIDYASISVTTHGGQIETLAPTDALAVQADELQYELGEGPCLQAALSDPVVEVDDVATDVRWPAYGEKAAALGIGSQMAFQFRADTHARGALNLYATQPHAIDDEGRQLSAMFAALVAVAMGWARHDQTLGNALASRTTIGQAIGILMERYRLDPDRAFGFLVRTSQTGNIKLREVADRIVDDAIRTAHKP
ncbi:GAF and ANTAR domain-containing protein [Kribbella sp. NPDC051586]|uniref:GAF and ANTAR domain-containing protein n=1 Tax=Kribbella sp. NPDC051586 TaxID=3364118 RepID=UPI00378767C9